MKLLWLASWFPNRTDLSAGDFIDRQAAAVAAMVDQLEVFHAVRDDKLNPGCSEMETRICDGYRVWIMYYRPPEWPGALAKLAAAWQYFRAFEKMWQACYGKSERPDLMHVHVAMRAGLVARRWKRKWKIPYLITEHWTGYYAHSEPSLHRSPRWYQQQTQRVLQEAACLLPVSIDLGAQLRQWVNEVPIQVVPNVVDTRFFNVSGSNPPEPARFVHFSYLTPQKNPTGIVQALVQLRDRGHEFRFDFFGAESAELNGLIASVGLSDFVQVHPAIPYARVAEEMQRSTALVMFSEFENQPCVILEALCCGLPVISSRVGGVHEIIDASNGLLVPSRDVEALAEAMHKLLTQRSTYSSMDIAARASAAYSYSVVASQLLSIYQSMLTR